MGFSSQCKNRQAQPQEPQPGAVSLPSLTRPEGAPCSLSDSSFEWAEFSSSRVESQGFMLSPGP